MATSRTLPFRHPAYVVGLSFFTLSVLFGSWLARLPEVQHQLALTDAGLGLALLGAPAGSLIVMPFANGLIDRSSSGAATLLFALFYCLAMLWPPLAGSGAELFLALFGVGLASGGLNIAMNAAASAIERQGGVRIMSTCHGLYSLGIVLGAGTAGSIAAMGVPLFGHLAALGFFFAVLQLLNRPSLAMIPRLASSRSGGLVWPPRSVWGLALIGLMVLIGEGAVADWSAIYLRRDLGSSLVVAGWGFAAFSVTMALGRFFGDRVRARIPARHLLVVGGCVGGTGLLGVVASPSPGFALAGFALAGAGYALLVPVLYSEGARLHPESPQQGISVVATAGITGLLAGPPLIGWIAGLSSLATGLAFAGMLALLAALLTWGLRSRS